MPDRIKIDQFNGLYTNIDESKLNPEYQSEAVNVRFRTGYIESEGYVSSEAVLPSNVIYQASVVLDDDRLKNRRNEFGEFVNDYKQNLQEYLMIVSLVRDKARIDFELLDSKVNNNIPSNSLTSSSDPTPLPPEFYLSGNSLPVLLYWERIQPQPVFARWWHIQISTSNLNNFESGIIYEKDNISPLPTNPSAASLLLDSPLQPYIEYFWRVRGKADGGQWGEFGPIQSLYLNNDTTIIEPPVLLSPLDNSTGIINPIKLEWTSVIGNNGYYFQIATDPNFSNVVKEIKTPKDFTSYAAITLDSLTQYYWRVLTLSSFGNSKWSEVWSFTTSEIIVEPTVYEFTKVYKHWNSNGIVLLLTDNGVYWIGKVNRTYIGTNIATNQIVITKYVNLDLPIDISIETLTEISPTLRLPLTLEVESLVVSDSANFIRWGDDPAVIKKYLVNVRYPDRYLKGIYSVVEWYNKKTGEYYCIDSEDWRNNILRVDGRSWAENEIRKQPFLSWLNTPVEGILTYAEADKFSGTQIEIVVTYTFNELDEYVIYYKKVTSSGATFFLKIADLFLTLENNISQDKRISGVSLYARTNEKDDFEQMMFYPILSGKGRIFPNDLYFSQGYLNGIHLSQTIGTVYSPSTYKPIDNFSDYLKIDGIAYAINNQRVYFPAIGKGQILNGTFYDYIPEVEGNFLSDVNGTLGVFGKQLKLVTVQDSREGYLLFSIKDKMNFQIRDQHDLATSPEGIIIHTKRGIYVTNGYERKMISEEINDIVERNFDTGNISYSPTDEMLFYTFKLGSEYYTFRYDFIYGKWSEVKPGIAGRLAFSENGIIHYLNESEGKVYKLDITNDIYSIVRTPSVDLDYPFLGKNLIYIDVDFEGILNYENYNITHTKRMTARLGIPVSKRIPNALIGAKFIFKGKIYTIDIYYDAIGEFRHENHIPLPEATPEGIQQYP